MPETRGSFLLLSGGMDSTTLLWWMQAQGVDEIHTVAVDYGQRHRAELDCGAKLSAEGGAQSHRVLHLDLTQLGGNPLTDSDFAVPSANEDNQIGTVVPFRNMLFVTLSAALAETQGILDIYLSPVRDDHESYRDCRREFYDLLEKTLRLGATRHAEFRVHTPFVEMWKKEVVRVGIELGVPYARTHTCYEGIRPACGKCDACAERLAAFAANCTVDPLPYK